MKPIIKLAVCFVISVSAAVLPLPASAALTGMDNFFVFGDSLSDNGNSGIATGDLGFVFPNTPYAPGRYTNGDVAFEYFWNAYNPGNPLLPSLAGGTNFALGGATTGLENYNAVNSNVPGFLQPAFDGRGADWQLGEFQNYLTLNGGFDPNTSLFGIWLFPNDIFYAFQEGVLSGTVAGSPGGPEVVSNGVANIMTLITTLALQGAENFLVPNMADLGMAPEFLGTPEASLLSFITQQFNQNLAQQLGFLALAFPGIDIIQVDVADIINQAIVDPAAYGFTNVSDGCVLSLCGNPDEYLFWDGVHTTTAGHRLVGERMLAAVSIPEPAMMLLLALGFLAMGLIQRWRRRAAGRS